MAFVNEIVSEEDIQKFGLDELKRQFDYYGWYDGRPKGFWHTWTIDRERGIWLVYAKMIEEIGPSDRPEPTNEHIFVLDWQGQQAKFTIERIRCPRWPSDSPYIIEWGLIAMDIPKTLDVPRNTVLPVFKEAMTVYGLRGAHSQLPPHALVEFKF
jgi:hypothetical protein